MTNLYRKIATTIFTIVLLVSAGELFAQNQRAIEGVVVDSKNNEPIPFALVYGVEIESGVLCDVRGEFLIRTSYTNSIELHISSLGYNTRVVKVGNVGSAPIKIALDQQSIKLDDVTVTATYSNESGSDATINREALDYINPTSIGDINALLPGGIVGSNNIQKSQYNSSRQVGSDQTTSFGIGVSIDGVPINNDGNRIQMSGFTGGSSIDPNKNTAVNSGVDLRTLSTDHIEKVVVKRGIASAREGNMSSGLIEVTSKRGAAPLTIRSKIDPLNKLIYAGKGFKLSDKLGTIHIGADVLTSANDVRNTLSAYNRITAQIMHTDNFTIGNSVVNYDQRISVISSFNNVKTDVETEDKAEEYVTRYARATYAFNADAHINSKLLDLLEFTATVDYANDLLKHDKLVNNPTVYAMQTSLVEGESEGVYLPSTYRTEYSIDNQPITAMTSLHASKRGNISKSVSYRIGVGNIFNLTKNIGQGSVVDPTRPPFPQNAFIRARANYEIPALMNNASYLDTRLTLRKERHIANISVGIRGTKMLNLPDDYLLSRRYLLEPRISAYYTHRGDIKGNEISNNFRVGYGVENKLPSMDYLYPDLIYEDFIVLNAYFTDPSKRLLLTNTKIHNPVNPNIRENRNVKLEAEWSMDYKGYNLSLTAFNEQMSGGVEYYNRYTPTSYTKYTELKYPVDGKPSKDDFDSYMHRTFTTFGTPTNSAKTVKRGLEYRFITPKLDAISSTIEINGAYYNTLYTSGVATMQRPSVILNGEAYPYVGLYDGFEKNYYERLNTNVWIHTHLPRFNLIFTNFFQIIWFESQRLGDDVGLYPSQYLTLDNQIVDVTLDEILNDPILMLMKRNINDAAFNEQREKVSLVMNVKLTKEFTAKHINKVRMSFFANNLIQVNSEYTTSYLQTRKKWAAPFFGVELVVEM